MISAPCITLLFVPCDRPERFAKAAASGADAIILDLEDAVAPAQKPQARIALCRQGALPENTAIFVRVNARTTPWHKEDLAALAALPLAGVMLPKTEAATDIEVVSQALPNLSIVALIESAKGVAAVRSIARARGVARLAFGSIDFCADLGAAHTRDALLFARAELVLASRLGGIAAPLDGVTAAIDDAALIEDDARYAQSLGFGGKLCIHPKQIAPARRGFAPSAEDIVWAKRILASAEDGAAAVDGAMVDAPVRARAQQILARVPRPADGF
jgi:citrate lyase subunit beta / citryl-CoA lyase